MNKKYEKIITPLKLNNPHIIVHKEIFSLSKSIEEIEIEHIDVENDKVIVSIDTSTKHNFLGTIIFLKEIVKICNEYTKFCQLLTYFTFILILFM